MAHSARFWIGALCAAMYCVYGHAFGGFYPFSPMGMFKDPATVSSRLFVRDAGGQPREIVTFDSWRCEGDLSFKAKAHCPSVGYSAYDEIVRNWILSHPAASPDTVGSESVEISRRIFQAPKLLGPLKITDCPLLRCTARRRENKAWIPRL